MKVLGVLLSLCFHCVYSDSGTPTLCVGKLFFCSYQWLCFPVEWQRWALPSPLKQWAPHVLTIHFLLPGVQPSAGFYWWSPWNSAILISTNNIRHCPDLYKLYISFKVTTRVWEMVVNKGGTLLKMPGVRRMRLWARRHRTKVGFHWHKQLKFLQLISAVKGLKSYWLVWEMFFFSFFLA